MGTAASTSNAVAPAQQARAAEQTAPCTPGVYQYAPPKKPPPSNYYNQFTESESKLPHMQLQSSTHTTISKEDLEPSHVFHHPVDLEPKSTLSQLGTLHQDNLHLDHFSIPLIDRGFHNSSLDANFGVEPPIPLELSPISPTNGISPQIAKQRITIQDGNHRWRKYGSKKAKDVNRAYFRCRNSNCTMKMVTETTVRNGQSSVNTIYKGEHNHDPPQVSHVEIHSQHELKYITETKTCDLGNTLDSKENSFAPKIICTLDLSVDPLDDYFHWRKYGQKTVKGSPHPRSYFKCTTASCQVKRQLERDANHFIVTYEGLHAHSPPDSGDNQRGSSLTVQDVSFGQKRQREEWETPVGNYLQEQSGDPRLVHYSNVLTDSPKRKYVGITDLNDVL